MADRSSDGPYLEDDVTSGGLPGGTLAGSPATPGVQVQVRAGATREYVAGAPLQFYVNIARALSWQIDQVTEDFGSDVYARMMYDAQVSATINVLRAAILETGVNASCAIDDKDDDGYEQAADLVDQVDEMFSNLTIALDDVIWDMLDAIAMGNRMAEQIFAVDTSHTGKQRYVLQTLAVKPYESTAFVVDAYLNVLGILGRIPGQPFGVQQGMLLADLEHTTNLLPRSKFAVLTFRPKNGDPRGSSLLRAAFSPWQQKQQLAGEFLKFLTQFASPSLIGFTAETAEPSAMANADGTPMLDAYGNPLIMTPEDNMLAALQAFANGTATAFPFGAKVQPIEMTGDGQPFLLAFDFLDKQITKAVLHQTLATEEGQHQSRAASGTHKDILDTITREAKRPVERMLERDVLATWLRLNGTPELLPLCPNITLGQAESEDFAPLWAGIAALQNSDYLHDSQYAELDRMVGLPERSIADATTIPIKETIAVAEVGGAIAPPDGTPAGDAKAVAPPVAPVAPAASQGATPAAAPNKPAAAAAFAARKAPEMDEQSDEAARQQQADIDAYFTTQWGKHGGA